MTGASAVGATPMACLSDEVVWAYLDGTLSAEERRAAEAHLPGCPRCLALVAEGARLAFPDDPPAEPAATLLPAGTRIGRYEIRGPRGAGASGVVYEAHDPQLQRRVALKLLRPQAGDSPERPARLLAEAQSMARIGHPHVVAAYDAGVHRAEDGQDEVFVVMELVEGPSLAEWLAEAPRSRAEILALFQQAGRGLAAVHAAGLVHGDFKPHNVLIGLDGRARVTDFGLARSPHRAGLHEGEAAAGGSTEGAPIAIAGTPLYMAPEQFLAEEVTPKSDQFSFAVALFWALHRRHPFIGGVPTGARAAELTRRVTTGALCPPGPDGVPAAVDEVVRRALAVRPEARWATMDLLLDALARADRRSLRRLAWLAVPAALGLGLFALRLATPLPRCGDGRLQNGEECDDGNGRDDDGCTARCLLCGAGHPGQPWAGSCYVRNYSPLPFAQALAACRAEDAELFVLSAMDEGRFVVNFTETPDDRSFWLGLTRPRPQMAFAWTTGEPLRASALLPPVRSEGPDVACAALLPHSTVGLYPFGWAAVACDHPLPFVCERSGWTRDPRTGHAYRLFSEAPTWTQAKAACAARGAHLLVIDDAAEQDAVASQVNLPIWLGVDERQGGGWRTVTGKTARYFAFASTEPDLPPAARCLVMDADHRWYDRPCDYRHSFVCEMEP